MNRQIVSIIVFLGAVIGQFAFFPSFLADPYKPNLLLPLVVYLGFTKQNRLWACAAFFTGLVQDAFSGLYTGLHGFSYLLTFFVLREIAGRLYTDSAILMTITVFIATILTAAVNVILLLLFSTADGIFTSVAYGVLPQALVNAIAALLIFGGYGFLRREVL